MPSCPSDFASLVAALSAQRRVLVPHFPGYGRTPADAEQQPLEATVLRLERRLVEMGVSEVDCVAFSGGAYRAVALALRARVAVGRVALLAPVVGLDPELAQAYRDLASAALAGTYDARPTWVDRMASPGFAVRDPEGAARVVAWLDAVSLPVLCAELVAIADAPDLRPLLGTLHQPVLVCSGTLDVAVPPASTEDVAKRLPHGTFRQVDGAGHALLIEAPVPTIALVTEFLFADDGPTPLEL
jgi:3-oxoadipate enol-lactonase